VVDVGLAAVAVTATVFVMNKDGCFHRHHVLVAHRTDITEARTERGEEPGYRRYTARWAPAAPPRSRASTAEPAGSGSRRPTRPRTNRPRRPSQLLLFAQEQPATAARPGIDLAALRTDLEALELTADQTHRTGTAFATVGDEARRRVRKPAHPNPEPARQ
jgi:hypothetical protein